MFEAIALSTLMVAVCIAIHYEMLRYTSILIPSLKVAVRVKVLSAPRIGMLHRPHDRDLALCLSVRAA